MKWARWARLSALKRLHRARRVAGQRPGVFEAQGPGARRQLALALMAPPEEMRWGT